jgi:hypothetical protein
MFDKSFETFSDGIEHAVNEIPANRVIQTHRKGLAGLRDKLVFGKAAWQEAMTYFGIVLSLVTLIALIPTAIKNINDFIKPTGIQFPVDVSSLATIAFLLFLFIFGFLSYKYFGMVIRSSEIGAKLSSCDFLEWQEEQRIKDGIQELKNMIEELKKCIQK